MNSLTAVTSILHPVDFFEEHRFDVGDFNDLELQLLLHPGELGLLVHQVQSV